jgi:hypothetical protein
MTQLVAMPQLAPDAARPAHAALLIRDRSSELVHISTIAVQAASRVADHALQARATTPSVSRTA